MIDWWRLLPRFWSQNRKTSWPWDRVLNLALDEHGVTNLTAHECRVGPFMVWISNYPYGFGYNRADALELLPSAGTRRKLRKAVEAAQAKAYAQMTWADH